MIMTIEARQWVDLEVIKFSMSIIRVTLKFNNNSFLKKVPNQLFELYTTWQSQR